MFDATIADPTADREFDESRPGQGQSVVPEDAVRFDTALAADTPEAAAPHPMAMMQPTPRRRVPMCPDLFTRKPSRAP